MNRSLAFLPVVAFLVLAVVMWRGLYLDSKELPSMLIDKPMPAFDKLTVDGQAVVDAAVAAGKLMGLVNCAGIAPAARTVGKEGGHYRGGNPANFFVGFLV